MLMRYQLWDQDRASMVADFPDLAEALVFVRAEAAEHGTDAVLALALVHVTADRTSLEPVAQGDVLLELSRLSLSTP